MNDARKTHPEIQATEKDLRRVAWWASMSQDGKRHVSRCEICQKKPYLGKAVSN